MISADNPRCNTIGLQPIKVNVLLLHGSKTADLMKLKKPVNMFKRKEIRSASSLQAC